jgi:hypothetical protein
LWLAINAEVKAMEPYQIEIGRSMAFALGFFSDAEREQVMRDVERLRDSPYPPEAPGVYVAPGAPKGDVFVLPALGDFRVLFTLKPDRTIFLKNIISQEAADYMFASGAKPATAR